MNSKQSRYPTHNHLRTNHISYTHLNRLLTVLASFTFNYCALVYRTSCVDQYAHPHRVVRSMSSHTPLSISLDDSVVNWADAVESEAENSFTSA
jgi:hypothetical protein